MKIKSNEVKREYIFTQKEIKKQLKLKGNISSVILWKGLSSFEKDNNKSEDSCEWVVETVEDLCSGVEE